MSQRIPTNIITGFLGAGKTTAILNLLQNKPAHENWAVLVNEFGEVGIDGAMMLESGAMIKEVAGGCMCCTAGVPTSVALTALLRLNPDRLLIEPTGLGHPHKILALLQSAQFNPYIEVKATLALLDPRHLSQEKYVSNANFNDQLAMADIVVANKQDLCTPSDIEAFEAWSAAQAPAKRATLFATNGDIEPALLEYTPINDGSAIEAEAHHHHHADMEPQFQLAPDQIYVRKENRGQGHFSCGWIFGAEKTFRFDGLMGMLNRLDAERIKGVMNTEQGCFAFNKASGVLSINALTLEGFESRIEVIHSQALDWDTLEQNLCQLFE
ncbi:GTP-binding protein [Vibrio sp. SM6]|uniref:GTP-binding protein n=1 Tax=Vibrio agarilyticus TaxID=2726741 RepID=A0A7X8YH70_9VIBR|nr:GTP-binding protein [Vibrio agarilyticus]NLS13793.1 GTP-binding protein [Vibrio agarilyticus]